MINGINAQVNNADNIGIIKLFVSSERSIGLLVDQINKLIDIKSVTVDNKATQSTSA